MKSTFRLGGLVWFVFTLFLALLADPLLAGDKEEKVRWKDLPEAVQKTIKANSQGGEIEEIEKEVEDGKVVYEAEVELKDGRELEIEVGEDGTLIEIEEDDDEDDDDDD